MAAWTLPQRIADWINLLSASLDQRSRKYLPVIVLGMILSSGRRTVSSWLRAAGVSDDWQDHYYFLQTLGRSAGRVATELLHLAVKQIPVSHIGPYVKLAIDDSPTKRYGPKVQLAGIHHNPTPGPSGSEFLYGHVWVTISWLVKHPMWGGIGLPLRALMYARHKDLQVLQNLGLAPWSFRTKLELAAELVEWCVNLFGNWFHRPVMVIADGAYAKRPFLSRVIKTGAIVVSRLRKDAALFDLPETIIEAVADRSAIEQNFHDVKEVHGSGQQQVRNVWCNVACWNLCLWMHTIVELWSWRRSGNTLKQRADRPWDEPSRRPSHADRLKTLRKHVLHESFSRLPPIQRTKRKIQALFKALTRLAT